MTWKRPSLGLRTQTGLDRSCEPGSEDGVLLLGQIRCIVSVLGVEGMRVWLALGR